MNEELNSTIDRLAAAATALEHLAQRLSENDEATIGRIVAQVEDRRTSELEQKLSAAEQTIAARDQRIAELEAAAGAPSKLGLGGIAVTEQSGRKTVPTATASLLAKQGVSLDSIEAGSLDAALTGLSLEQRFAVKAQLLRAGLLS